VGEKDKKQGQIGKISALEASRAVAWGGGRAAPPSPLPRLPPGSLHAPIFFFANADFFLVFLPNVEPGPKLT